MHMEQESEEENQEQYPKIMEQTYSREGKKIQLKWLFLVCLFYKPFKKHFFLVVCKFSLQIKSFKPDSFFLLKSRLHTERGGHSVLVRN